MSRLLDTNAAGKMENQTTLANDLPRPQSADDPRYCGTSKPFPAILNQEKKLGRDIL